MYRYSVDNAVTYTPDDLALFRESPFALWMERLTLENPDHGIPPDLHGTSEHKPPLHQDDIVATLRAEGRDVAFIDGSEDEPARRAATLAAMRTGTDFIVNGLLALGPLAGTAKLLMRTSGYSELGDFLYVPCDSQGNSTLQSAFRLCFLADLLQNLQGQLPPQMLIIRGDADVVPLHSEDHIYYYRAVKKRFMEAMASFRKHRMPDPAESAHFGRWSECASEVLRQRALSEEQRDGQAQDLAAEELARQLEEQAAAAPRLQVAGMSGRATSFYQVDSAQLRAGHSAAPGAQGSSSAAAVSTLAEQARMLAPDSFKVRAGPGHTPNLARFARSQPVAPKDDKKVSVPAADSDAALQNLAFIGSGPEMPFSTEPSRPEPCEGLGALEAPAPSLNLAARAGEMTEVARDVPAAHKWPDLEPAAPYLLPPDEILPVAESAPAPEPEVTVRHAALRPVAKRHPLDSLVDSDAVAEIEIEVMPESVPLPELTPIVERAEAEFGVYKDKDDDPLYARRRIDRQSELSRPRPATDKPATGSSFSSSLRTSDEYDDD